MTNCKGKFIAITLLASVGLSCFAKEEWLCTEQSSQIENGNVLACGVAEGKDENDARTKAFENARAEFIRVCESSDDCKAHKVSVEPKRTTCERSDKNSVKCYRLLVFTVSQEVVQPIQSAISNSTSRHAGRLPAAQQHIDRITLEEKNEVFAPFVYESIKNNPKVRRGMTKRDLLAGFGAPEKVEPSMFKRGVLEMMFSGSMCDFNNLCYVDVQGDFVVEYRSFKPIYTEDLK